MMKDETIAAARIGKAVSQIKRSIPFSHSHPLFPSPLPPPVLSASPFYLIPTFQKNAHSPPWKSSHDDAARVLLLRGGVEHLALGAEVGRLGDEVVELLAAL